MGPIRKTWKYAWLPQKAQKTLCEPMFNTWSNAYPYCYKSISRDSVAPARPPEASSTQLPPLGRAPGGNTWHLFLCALGVLFFCVRHIFTFYGLAPFFTDVSAFAKKYSKMRSMCWSWSSLSFSCYREFSRERRLLTPSWSLRIQNTSNCEMTLVF